MHNIILLPLCHQQKGEVPQSNVCDVSFNSMHEKYNIKFYHHAILLENIASFESCCFEAKKFSKCYIMLRTFKLSSFRYASFTAYKIAHAS